MRPPKREAVAVDDGQVIATCPVPRGTTPERWNGIHGRGMLVFTFVVKWWAIPYYLFHLARLHLKEGLRVYVEVKRDTPPTPASDMVELTPEMQLPDSGTVYH